MTRGLPRLTASLLIAVAASCAHAQDLPKLPPSCAARPTADCLVDSVIREASSKEAIALVNGATALTDHGRRDLARRLLRRAEELLSGSASATQAESMADAWHRLGKDQAAEKDLEMALNAITPSADLELQPPSPGMPKPLPSALDYRIVASNQAKWGLTDRAKATLARMRADLPTLTADAAADIEVRAWRNGKRMDLALAAAEADPEEKDWLISNSFLSGCYPTNDLSACSKAAAKIDGAWASAIAYSRLVAEAVRDHPRKARRILETGIAAFAKATDDSMTTRGFSPDPVVVLARAWLGFDDPARALKTLDLRATRPDLFPPTVPVPIDDYVFRAELLVRLGRIDEALKTAEAATANFAARPGNNLEKFRATFHADAGSQGGTLFDRPVQAFNDGDRAYQAIIDTLAKIGKPDAIKAVVARFPMPADPDTVDLAVMQADLSAKRWDDALAILRTPAARPSAGMTAAALAREGQDELASEAASIQLHAGSTIDASAFLEVADIQMKAGRRAAARATLSHLDRSEIDSHHGLDLQKFGLAQAELGDFQGAWATLSRTGLYFPDYYSNTAITLQARAGDRAGALAHAETAQNTSSWIQAILALAVGL